jgi:hypothetical protein
VTDQQTTHPRSRPVLARTIHDAIRAAAERNGHADTMPAPWADLHRWQRRIVIDAVRDVFGPPPDDDIAGDIGWWRAETTSMRAEIIRLHSSILQAQNLLQRAAAKMPPDWCRETAQWMGVAPDAPEPRQYPDPNDVRILRTKFRFPRAHLRSAMNQSGITYDDRMEDETVVAICCDLAAWAGGDIRTIATWFYEGDAVNAFARIADITTHAR